MKKIKISLIASLSTLLFFSCGADPGTTPASAIVATPTPSPKTLYNSWSTSNTAFTVNLTGGSNATPMTAIVGIPPSTICHCTMTFTQTGSSGNATSGTCTQTGGCTTVSGAADCTNASNTPGWCGLNGSSSWADDGTYLTFGGTGMSFQ